MSPRVAGRARQGAAAAASGGHEQMQADQLPKAARDLEVKKREDTGPLRYAYNGFEVLVTPRRHREKFAAEGRDAKVTWRDRELTPDRALRKLCDKIKRSLNKATRWGARGDCCPRATERETRGCERWERCRCMLQSSCPFAAR